MALLLEEGALYKCQVEILTDDLANIGVGQEAVRNLQSVPGRATGLFRSHSSPAADQYRQVVPPVLSGGRLAEIAI